jgi:hypothetical protein
MTTKSEAGTSMSDWLNPLPMWWRFSDVGGLDDVAGQMRRFQTFASDLQKACGDVYGEQMAIFVTGNGRLARLLERLPNCRQPNEVFAVQSDILATVLEGASLQAKTWIDLTQRMQECCATMTRHDVEAAHQDAEGKRWKKPAARPAQMTDGEARKYEARA